MHKIHGKCNFATRRKKKYFLSYCKMRFLRILWVVCQLSVSCLSVVCQLSVGCLSVLSRALVLCFAGCLSAGCPFLAALWRKQFGPHFARPVERVCNLPKGKERKSEASCGGGRQSGLPFITKAKQEHRQGSTTLPLLPEDVEGRAYVPVNIRILNQQRGKEIHGI